MNVQAIRLENFMAFEDTDWIDLRPITLLFGLNSSGKSVIIRALRLLKQSLHQAPEGEPFAFFVEDGVDMGNLLVIAHGPEKTKYQYSESLNFFAGDTVSISFRCSVPPMMLSTLTGESNIPEAEAIVDLVLDYAWYVEMEKDIEHGKAVLSSFSLNVPWFKGDEKGSDTIFRADRMRETDQHGEEWWFSSNLLYRHEVERDYWPPINILYQHGFMPKIEVQFLARTWEENYPQDLRNTNAMLQYLASEINSFLDSIEYMPPIRPEPRRYYVMDDTEMRQWERQGLKAFLRLVTNELNDPELTLLSNWLERMELAESIHPENIANIPGRAALTELSLDEGQEGMHNVKLVDVGFGNSQVLPVIMESILAKPGSLIIIEQPELHLHPGAQVQLIDLFIEQIRRDITYLIETHSENMLLRLRTRLAETQVDQKRSSSDFQNITLHIKDVRAYFVERNHKIGESWIVPIEFGKRGEFQKIPPGFERFFSDNLVEIAEWTRFRFMVKKSSEELQ